jgi:hypothetical protein
MGAAAAVIITKQRHIVEAFERARATSPERARHPDEVGVDQAVLFDGLVRRAVLRPAGDGRYYLDEPSWRALRSRRHRMAVVLGFIVVLAGLFAALTTVRHF